MKVLLLTAVGALFFAYYWADNFDPASLQGARVLLTGASAGVGEELAYHYARLGSHLVLTAHTEALLQKVVGNCRKLGAPKVFYIAADMASPEVPERVVQFALDKLGEGRGLKWAGLPRAESPRCRPSRHAGPQRPGSTLAHAGELPELRATNFVGSAQSDGKQGLPGGGVIAAGPRAQVLLQPLFGGQVCSGQLLQLPAAGAGRAGRERGRHHVRPGPLGSGLGRRGSQGCHEGQGSPGAQGGPHRDPWRRHAHLPRLLSPALPPALRAPGLAATPEGLVRQAGAQRDCCLSSWV